TPTGTGRIKWSTNDAVAPGPALFPPSRVGPAAARGTGEGQGPRLRRRDPRLRAVPPAPARGVQRQLRPRDLLLGEGGVPEGASPLREGRRPRGEAAAGRRSARRPSEAARLRDPARGLRRRGPRGKPPDPDPVHGGVLLRAGARPPPEGGREG